MQNIEDLLEAQKSRDPKITIAHNTISLAPYYWNYYFVSTLVPIAVSIYVLLRQNDEMINFFCILISIAFLIILVIHLRYYNTVVVNFSDKTIIVDPNSLMKFFVKRKIISFKDVSKFEVEINSNTGGWRPTHRRYIIALVLKNAENIKLLSSDKLSIAKQIEKSLYAVVSAQLTV